MSTANELVEELKRDADKGELLLWASARGLQADVEELVGTGADARTKDKNGRQAVHYAASNGHADILEYLSTKGVDLDAEDNNGRGALHYAAAGGHAACVSLLLAKGCWRDAPDAADDCPLHLAARHGGLEAIKALVEAGAKAHVPNKRSLTPFAEAVLAGRTQAAEYLGGRAEGGLRGALAATYRGVPLLHLAAGLGRAAAVEWLLGQPGCDAEAPFTESGLTPLHAAALAGDDGTVQVLLRRGADPLSQTKHGKLPLELVPKAAPPKAPPPPPPPGSLPPPPEAAAGEGAVSARERRALERCARRAFKALARAAAQQGGVEAGRSAARRRREAAGGRDGAAAAGAAAEEAEAEGTEDEGADSPAAVFLRQFVELSPQQQAAKAESYARMDERQVAELPYLDSEAQAAILALRQRMAMVELFGAIAALRGDEEFQSDIRDPALRSALEDVKKTNSLERYENQAAVMSVTAKFKRLHAITRKTGGLKVVIDDIRADLPGNDPASTAAQMEGFRHTQAEAALRAAKEVLRSASAAVPEPLRSRILSASKAAEGGEERPAGKAEAAKGASRAAGASSKEIEPDGAPGPHEDDRAFEARMAANQARMDKLCAAATASWTDSDAKVDEDIGFVDRHAKEFEQQARKAEGRQRKRLADYVGEEVANSLMHTLKALLITLLAFAVMWCFGLMPHQQAASLMAKHAQLEAARAAAAGRAAGAGPPLEGLDGGHLSEGA